MTSWTEEVAPWRYSAVLTDDNRWRLRTGEISGTKKCQSLRVSNSLKENNIQREVTLLATSALEGENVIRDLLVLNYNTFSQIYPSSSTSRNRH